MLRILSTASVQSLIVRNNVEHEPFCGMDPALPVLGAHIGAPAKVAQRSFAGE
jgi:hypothetical protein